MITESLVYALLAEDHSDALIRYRQRLSAMLSVLPKETNGGYPTYKNVLSAILMFQRDRGKCPNKGLLLQYALTLPNDGETLGLNEALRSELEELDENWVDRQPEISDIDLLVQESLKEARATFWAQNLAVAKIICTDGRKTREGVLLKGPDDALQYLAQLRSRDLQSEARRLSGFLHEHTDHAHESLAQALRPQIEGRWRLGFSFIDDYVLVGRGANMNRFIGILGHSGEGKSTVLHSLVYNLLCQGATVLYNSLEHDPEELWEIMAFQAYERYHGLAQLPPRFIFDMARAGVDAYRSKITEEHVAMIELLTDDIKSRRHVSGAVDCQQFHSFAEIIEHLNSNHKKWSYDVVVIDYLGMLDVGADMKLEQSARKKLIAECQKLTRHFDNDRGIVLISPIQVNRAGKEAADKVEGGARRYSPDAIREYSEYCHFMDFIFSVYSTPYMRQHNEVEIDMVKSPRKGRQPKRGSVFIDPSTGRVLERADEISLDEFVDEAIKKRIEL